LPVIGNRAYDQVARQLKVPDIGYLGFYPFKIDSFELLVLPERLKILFINNILTILASLAFHILCHYSFSQLKMFKKLKIFNYHNKIHNIKATNL